MTAEGNKTEISAPFIYVNPGQSYIIGAQVPASNATVDRVADNVFALSLMSPNSSKNGTQDIFGNLQLPFLEYLTMNQDADEEGWLYTMDSTPDIKGWKAAVIHAIGLPKPVQPIYASIVGLPFKANLTAIVQTPPNTSKSELKAKIQQITADLFGEDAINTESLFSIESSYMYTNCTAKPITTGSILDAPSSVRRNVFPNGTVGIASNQQGFAIAFDGNRSSNATTPRRIGVQSWLGLSNNVGFSSTEPSDSSIEVFSEAWCDVTQTYVEAEVYCRTEGNCTVARIRESRQPHNSSALTALDGVTFPWSLLDGDVGTFNEVYRHHRDHVAENFFTNMLNSIDVGQLPDINLSPLESYFSTPSNPFKASLSGQGASSGQSGQRPITEVGDQLFSWRLAQLLNTYWLASIEPYVVPSGIDLEMTDDGDANRLPVSAGQMYVERTIFRCHMLFFAILLVISIGLFLAGMATAYLDATRLGPDVLDDFVNHLRHNPYVLVDKLAPTMADGQEMARALRGTVVQMGDVRPDAAVGYVAIGTPNAGQAVERLKTTGQRRYL